MDVADGLLSSFKSFKIKHSNISGTQILHITHKNKQWIVASEAVKDDISGDWFCQEHWLNQGRLLGANSGRGSAWVIKSEWGKWVLRHYLRGGLYAKLNKDHYLWSGLKNTRAYKEYALLQQLQTLDLPAPVPVAARIQKKGLMYQNDLIMAHLPHRQTLAQAITDNAVSDADWRLTGQTIARFHQHKVYHADLNTHNILLADDMVHIIDFDKGQIRSSQGSWCQHNLSRLKRSVDKVCQVDQQAAVDGGWQILMEGYHG